MGNSQHTPVKLGIGLPVYNGEVFIEEALESILAQNFQDFELIISDNASTDRTESICRIFAERDPRVKYYRNEQNIGVGPNHNRVFELSANEYFKWISYDDVHDHRFLEQCIRILDNDQSLVLAYSLAKTIDSKGKHLNEWGYFPELGSNQPHIRFRSSLSPPKGPLPLPIYGVIRSAILCKTSLLPGYSGCDRVLLSELSLYGRFYEISSALFFQREHHNRTGRILSDNPNMARRIWGGAQCGGLNLPFLGKFSVLRNALARPPLEFIERLLCYREFYVWIRREKKGLLNDLVLAEGRLSFVASFVQRYLDRKRKNDIRHLAKDIELIIPEGAEFILFDDWYIGPNVFSRIHPILFLEREGKYWGLPVDGEELIEAVEILREKGAVFLVVVRPAFWWLDYYLSWSEYLSSEYQCIKKNKHIVVYDIR